MRLIERLHDRRNNFTFFRIIFALSVLFAHSYAISLGNALGTDPISYYTLKYWGESLGSIAVDFFFVISGFLVCASYHKRKNLFIFLEARFLRIVPGLAVAVTFCILAGSIATTLQFSEYFSSPLVLSFFKFNVLIINGLQFELPNVFLNNPLPSTINGSLWSLYYEVWLYIIVAILGSLSIINNKSVFNLFFFLTVLVYSQSTGDKFLFLDAANRAQLALLFMLGAFFYINRSQIEVHIGTFISLCILLYLSKFIFLLHEMHFNTLMKSICFSYLLMLLIFHPKIRLPSIDKWDISFGLYIYAFPTQQMIAYSLPNIRPLPMFLLSLFLTTFFAILSWKYIEEPALSLKGKLPFRRKLAV